MINACEQWCEKTLQAIQKTCASESRKRYSKDGNLSHYLGLAQFLETRFEDEILTKAAFLHGVNLSEAESLLYGKNYFKNIHAVLNGRMKLVSVNLNDPDTPRRFVANVLPTVKDIRPVILFLFEFLHHLDPDGVLSKWTKNFHVHPSPLPDHKLPVKIKYRIYNIEDKFQELFIRSILARTAEFYGFWHERNVFNDAALYYFHKNRFEQLIKEATEFSDLCDQVVMKVKNEIQAIPIDNIWWEWRHVASISDRLNQNRSDVASNLHRLGFVTIVCNEEEDCYKALYLLHKKFGCRLNQLRDYLETFHRYRAIHTHLSAPDTLVHSKNIKIEAIPVRLVPKGKALQRMKEADKELITSIAQRIPAREREIQLKVFTPEGKPVLLPLGSTVLNFAYTLHNSLVARLRGATVNLQPAGIFTTLNNGDSVWLDISDTPILLPLGWEDQVPEDTEKKILKKFKEHYRPALYQQGRKWLKKQIYELGICKIIHDSILDYFTKQAIESSEEFIHPKKIRGELSLFDWWLKQLGILELKNRGTDYHYQLSINEKNAKTLVKEMADIITQFNDNLRMKLDTPNFKGSMSNLDLCGQCSPDLAGNHIITFEKNNIVKVHSNECQYADDGFPFSLIFKSESKYFVIESLDRTGMAAAVFNVFFSHSIDIDDLVGRKFGTGRGVFRVQVNFIHNDQIHVIEKGLQEIEGVKSVSIGTEQSTCSILEKYLPPRQPASFHEATPTPYFAGSPVSDNAFFYGMEKELAFLNKKFRIAASNKHNGLSIFISGPKRIGKSSLVLQFIRELEFNLFPKCLPIYYRATKGRSWEKVKADIYGKTKEKVSAFINTPLTGFDDAEKPLEEIIIDIKNTLEIQPVVIIDEATNLFLENIESDQKSDLLRFLTFLIDSSGMFVIFIGHEASLFGLDNRYVDLLANAEPLRLKGLTMEETASLLLVKKLSGKYTIKCSDTLVKKAYNLTMGNPYWASLLGKSMWDRASRKSNIPDTIEYDTDLLEKAKRDIFETGIAFVDRIPFQNDYTDWHIINFLAFNYQDMDSQQSLDDIYGYVKKHVENAEKNQIRKELEILHLKGTVTIYADHPDPSYGLAAPILAEYFLYRYG